MSRRSLTDETVSGISWQFSAVFANIVLRAAILVLLARNLPAADFGIVAAATVVTSVTDVFSQIGVSRALVQRLTLQADHIKSAFAISLYTGLAATAAIYFAAPWISSLFQMDGLAPFVKFLSAVLILSSISAVPAALLQRERRFRTLGLIELGSYVLGFGLVAFPMAKADFGAWSLAVGQLVQTLARATALYAVRRPVVSLLPNISAARELLRVGYGFSAGQVGNFLATQVDYLIVGRWLGAEALGFYNRAYQFLMLPAKLFGTAAGSVLFPLMATIQDQPDRVGRAYLRALGVIAMITLPASGVLMILAPELVRLVLGQDWRGMIPPFEILIATLLFRTSYKISDAVTLAMGSMYQRALRQWIYAAAVSAGAFAGTYWGLSGVALGVSAAVILHFAMMTQLALRLTGLSAGPVIRLHLRQLAAAVVIVAPVWIVARSVRQLDLGTTAVLSASIVMAAASGALFWFRFPVIFGEDGAWVHNMITSRLRRIISKRPPDLP